MDCGPPGSSVHGDSPGKNTGVVCHSLLQGIFLTQGSNPRCLHLLHWQADPLSQHYLGSPCSPNSPPTGPVRQHHPHFTDEENEAAELEDEKSEAKQSDSRSPNPRAILPLQTHLDETGFSPWSPGTSSNTHTEEGRLPKSEDSFTSSAEGDGTPGSSSTSQDAALTML